MCAPASMIVRKADVLWSRRTDSHQEQRAEFDLPEITPEQVVAGNVPYVAIEITPPNGDFCAPLDAWEFRVDQDILPTWWKPAREEARVREALVDWLAARVVLPGAERAELSSAGNLLRVYGTVQRVYGTVQSVYGTVLSVESGGTVLSVWSGGTVQSVKSGGTVQSVYGTVQSVWSGGTVQSVWSGGTVITYTKQPKIILAADAVLVDRSGGTVKCRVGKGK